MAEVILIGNVKGVQGDQGIQGERGTDGTTPRIGENKHWWIGDTDTGILAEGKDGLTPFIGTNGNWWIGSADTGVLARGTNGVNGANGKDGLTPYIGSNKNWWIGDVDTGVSAVGKDGADGTNGTDGKDGANGQDGKDGVNGEDGKDGTDGATPYVGSNNNWWIGNVDTGILAEGTDGITPHIGENKHWWIGDVDTGIFAEGIDGKDALIASGWYNGTGTYAYGEGLSLTFTFVPRLILIAERIIYEDQSGGAFYLQQGLHWILPDKGTYIRTSASTEQIGESYDSTRYPGYYMHVAIEGTTVKLSAKEGAGVYNGAVNCLNYKSKKDMYNDVKSEADGYGYWFVAIGDGG